MKTCLFSSILFKHKHKYTGQWGILKTWVYSWVLKVAVISMHRVCPVWISPPALLEFLALASPQCISVSLNRANSVPLMTAPLILIDWQVQIAHSPPSSHTYNVGCWNIWIPREEIWHKRRQHILISRTMRCLRAGCHAVDTFSTHLVWP